jgi:hypothetical protein
MFYETVIKLLISVLSKHLFRYVKASLVSRLRKCIRVKRHREYERLNLTGNVRNQDKIKITKHFK